MFSIHHNHISVNWQHFVSFKWLKEQNYFTSKILCYFSLNYIHKHLENDTAMFIRTSLGYYAARSGNFVLTFRDNQSVTSSILQKDSWTLEMGLIGCPETLVRNCQYSLRNNTEERSSRLYSRRKPEIRSVFQRWSKRDLVLITYIRLAPRWKKVYSCNPL